MKTKSKFKLPKLYARDEQSSRTGGRFGAKKSPRKRPRRVSDYGMQLKEKQKIRYTYGLREQPFRNYVIKASSKTGEGDASSILHALLETRLDSAVFRMGLARERSTARQIVSHGHIAVNGRRVTVPSYRTRVGDVISVREQSRDKGVFKDLDITLKKYSPPSWLALDADKREAEIVGAPSLDEAGVKRSLDTIIEFYSR